MNAGSHTPPGAETRRSAASSAGRGRIDGGSSDGASALSGRAISPARAPRGRTSTDSVKAGALEPTPACPPERGRCGRRVVEVARIDSFIATLGAGTVLYALALWYTSGRQVVGVPPQGLLSLSGALLFGLPITGRHVVAVALVPWFVSEHMPLGRSMDAIGRNPRAAALNGIPVARCTVLAFTLSGLRAGIAGVLLASKLRIGQASVGLGSCCRRSSGIPGLDHDPAGARQRVGHAARQAAPSSAADITGGHHGDDADGGACALAPPGDVIAALAPGLQGAPPRRDRPMDAM